MNNKELLFRQMQKGDSAAFKSFFSDYYQSLVIFGKSYLKDSIKSEDLVQDVFIKFWEKRADFINERSAKSYLYTAVRNKCLNELQHRKVVSKHEELLLKDYSSEDHFSQSIIEADTFSILFREIKLLPASAQKVMLLALKGLKNPQIAEKLDISVNTVKTQKKIAYAKLKGRLSNIDYFAFLF